jgi:hypothetical protein
MMNIKKNICITTNVSILFKIHDTLQQKYDTLQQNYDTLQEKYDTLVVKKDIIFNLEIQNNDTIDFDEDTISNYDTISNEDTISNDDTINDTIDFDNDIISNIIDDIISNIINDLIEFEFIESKKSNETSYKSSRSNTIWSKFTNKFLYS